MRSARASLKDMGNSALENEEAKERPLRGRSGQAPEHRGANSERFVANHHGARGNARVVVSDVLAVYMARRRGQRSGSAGGFSATWAPPAEAWRQAASLLAGLWGVLWIGSPLAWARPPTRGGEPTGPKT